MLNGSTSSRKYLSVLEIKVLLKKIEFCFSMGLSHENGT